MNYTRMLCWVSPHEKKELIEAVDGRFPLAFAKNYDDFRQKISKGDYLVVSFMKATFKKTRSLVQNFPGNIFSFFEVQKEYVMTSAQFNISDEPNAVAGQYGAVDLVNNYLGIIPDLWEMRLKQKIII